MKWNKNVEYKKAKTSGLKSGGFYGPPPLPEFRSTVNILFIYFIYCEQKQLAFNFKLKLTPRFLT
jgi:hypothetical protein